MHYLGPSIVTAPSARQAIAIRGAGLQLAAVPECFSGGAEVTLTNGRELTPDQRTFTRTPAHSVRGVPRSSEPP